LITSFVKQHSLKSYTRGSAYTASSTLTDELQVPDPVSLARNVSPQKKLLGSSI